MYTITIKGIDVDADLNDGLKGLQLELIVKAIVPLFERTGEDIIKATGKRRNSRSKWLSLRVEFAPFGVTDQTVYNDLADYMNLMDLLDYAEVWIKSTTLPATTGLWTALLPRAVEANDISLSEDPETGTADLSITFDSRDAY